MDENPTPSGTGSESLDPVRSILEGLCGSPVLLPIACGQKRPLFDKWEQLTFAQTQHPEHPMIWSAAAKDGTEERKIYRTSTYGAELERVRTEGGNLGVTLGATSRMTGVLDLEWHLVTIDVDDDEGVEPFLALNPNLARTLRTRGRRGCNFWLWIQADDYHKQTRKLHYALPDGTADQKRPWGEWRAKGGQTIIWGVHPDTGQRYKRISETRTPITYKFSDIVWPEGLSLPWMPTPAEQVVAEVGPGWRTSDKGAVIINQPYFAALYAKEHHVLFEPDEAAFYVYEAARGLWIKTSEDAIQWAITCDIKKVADAEGVPELITARTAAFNRGIVQILRGRVEKRDAFRREAGLIHLRNCMLDLRAGEFKTHPFSPKHYSRNQVPVDFDETATCAMFTNSLVGPSVLSAARADLLQRWAGSLLLGPNVMQRFALLYGTAGGGKSTFVSLVRKMIGEANCTQLRTKHLEERFEMFFYVGKSLLIAPDVNGDFLQQEGAHVLKALVGGDPLSAERKQGGAAIQITGDFHIAITCNSRLLIKLEGDADAFRRRMLPIHYCLPKPAKRIDDFASMLFLSESSGILNWMLAGARRVLEEKRTHGDYVLTAEQQEEIDSLLAESDSVRHFISHAVEKAGAGDTITIAELCEAYVGYCDDKGWRAESFKKAANTIPDAVSEFWHMTPRNDIKRGSGDDGKPKSQRGYKGLRLTRQAGTGDLPAATPAVAASTNEEGGDDAQPY